MNLFLFRRVPQIIPGFAVQRAGGAALRSRTPGNFLVSCQARSVKLM
jgi:hypothetical protein